MKKTGSSNIKYIVIIGYVLVVAIMVVGLITIYNTLVDFSEKKIKQEDLSELLIVGNTLSKLYEIESGQNLFDAESARSYFHTYDSIVPIIKLNLDSLQQMTSDEVRINKLDSIKLLIGKKNENLKEVAVLLDSIRKAPRITRETVSGFVPKKLNKEITDYLESKNLNTPEKPQNDTSVVYGERRGFLSRVRDVFVARSDSTILVEKKTVIQE